MNTFKIDKSRVEHVGQNFNQEEMLLVRQKTIVINLNITLQILMVSWVLVIGKRIQILYCKKTLKEYENMLHQSYVSQEDRISINAQ